MVSLNWISPKELNSWICVQNVGNKIERGSRPKETLQTSCSMKTNIPSQHFSLHGIKSLIEKGWESSTKLVGNWVVYLLKLIHQNPTHPKLTIFEPCCNKRNFCYFIAKYSEVIKITSLSRLKGTVSQQKNIKVYESLIYLTVAAAIIWSSSSKITV